MLAVRIRSCHRRRGTLIEQVVRVLRIAALAWWWFRVPRGVDEPLAHHLARRVSSALVLVACVLLVVLSVAGVVSDLA